MAVLTLDNIRAALARVAHQPAVFEAAPHHAAVAMILASDLEHLEVCFIRRAERAGDPWSGQVAFPGGRAGPSDLDAQAVAERETREEIGVDLGTAQRIGALPVRTIQRPEMSCSMQLSPFVYHVAASVRRDARVCLPHEVASVFWVPLAHLFDESTVTQLEYSIGDQAHTYPGIQYQEHIIWGLTLRILASFAALMSLRLPALPYSPRT